MDAVKKRGILSVLSIICSGLSLYTMSLGEEWIVMGLILCICTFLLIFFVFYYNKEYKEEMRRRQLLSKYDSEKERTVQRRIE